MDPFSYYAQTRERALQEMDVKRVAVPNLNTSSSDRRKLEKSRWFKKAQHGAPDAKAASGSKRGAAMPV